MKSLTESLLCDEAYNFPQFLFLSRSRLTRRSWCRVQQQLRTGYLGGRSKEYRDYILNKVTVAFCRAFRMFYELHWYVQPRTRL
ncbi:hypothetical protein B7P43_G04299 [Cryptotermes secundus]|uniref:Uncharacterized protein n=1 Tax=Cryptotermes secundus TaxID=105785 RepID=A0A2J7Q692_9NEOP|nr:hypothetical protein B7P43_G04299 [Cryptotermes secundus]